ncbi:MAG: hypothetical protein AAGC60_18020 [Acidobacteriota bacterium]
MRPTIFTICLILLAATPAAASPNALHWTGSFAEPVLDWFFDVVEDLGGGIVSSGVTDSEPDDDEIGGGIVSSGLADDDAPDDDEIGGGIVSSGLRSTDSP